MASYDVIDGDYDPVSYDDSHGSSCAGIVGSVHNNDECGVGIAYDSNIGGIYIAKCKTFFF